MKIHVYKIQNGPPHGLCVPDVRLILASVPPGWIEGFTEVRLCNGPGPRAYPLGNRLAIYSRGCSKKEILIAVLSVLASPSLNIKNVVARSPSSPEQHRIDQFIQPLVEKLLPQLNAQREHEDEYHAPWKPMSFSPFPNDDA